MKILISESQYNKITKFNTSGVNLIINSYSQKEYEPLTEGWLNTLGDVLGILDPTGIIDLGNSISYWRQDRKLFSLLSFISIIPGADFVTKPFILGGKIIAGTSEAPIIGRLLKTFDTWGGKVLNKLDDLLFSKIPIVKSFANGMRKFIMNLKKDSLTGIKESIDSTNNEQTFDFNALFEECYPKIFLNICLRYANGDRDKAQDFCQNGFLKAYQKRSKMMDTDNCGWLSVLIRNNILDELRKEKTSGIKIPIDKMNLGSYDQDYDFDDENGLILGKYSKNELESAIDKLSPKYKSIFTKFYLDGKDHKTIADEEGISDSTSKSNLHKAKKNIKKYLQKLKRD